MKQDPERTRTASVLQPKLTCTFLQQDGASNGEKKELSVLECLLLGRGPSQGLPTTVSLSLAAPRRKPRCPHSVGRDTELAWRGLPAGAVGPGPGPGI